MSIFKNANETAFVGGRKHWTDVIKNSGPEGALLWRQPEEDFNTLSTLIVMPGETAMFVNEGKVVQTFAEPGTYKLSTKNYPFISRLRNMFSGGVSVFNCVVYFVRTAHSAQINWGTASPIQVRDKLLGIATQIRSHGSYRVRISDPVIFLEKLVGSNIPLQTQEDLNKYFSNQFQSKVIAFLTQTLNDTDTELLGVAARIEEFSQALRPQMQALLTEYGLECVSFTIAALDIADDELRRRYDEIGMDAIAKLREARAQKGVMEILDSDWERQQRVNILQSAAQNPGAAGTGAGIGLGLAGMGTIGAMAGQALAPDPGSGDPVEALGKLKRLLEAGLIEQAEYDAKKAEILARL